MGRLPATCDGCGRYVRWHRRVDETKRVMLDFLPSSVGDFAILDDDRALRLGPGDRLADHENTERFLEHWKTCPAYVARRHGRS